MTTPSRKNLKLIVFSGLPGAGKSMLADRASKELGLPILAKDWIETTLWRDGIDANLNSGSIAYDLLTTLAKEQLQRNVSVIIDSVATSASIRKVWRSMAEDQGARFIVIECICSDEAVHKQRLSTRKRNIEGWHELTWEDVLEVQSRYHPWTEERLVLDSIDDLQANSQKLLEYVSHQLR